MNAYCRPLPNTQYHRSPIFEALALTQLKLHGQAPAGLWFKVDVATLNVIRRWALLEQMSIREISRRTDLARNTVKKYLRSDETETAYVRRVGSSKLDPYAEKLPTWLGLEVTKSRKHRRNLKQIYTVW